MRHAHGRALLVVVALWSAAYSGRAFADLPDLGVTGVAGVPATFSAGGSFTVSSTVVATGGAAGSFTVGVYLSSDGAIEPTDALVGSRAVYGLALGASSTGTSYVTLPAGLAPGAY